MSANAAGTDATPAGPTTSDRVWPILLGCSAAVTLAWVVVLVVWDDAPFAFTFDDAYYYLGIARNLVEGAGSTFDTVNRTNGYHPLWLLTATVPFELGLDGLAAMRAVLVFQVIAGWGATLVVISRIVSRSVEGWAGVSRRENDDRHRARVAAMVTLAGAFVLLAINPFVVKVFVNGLETGITVTLLAVLLLIGSRPRRSWVVGPSRGWQLGVGALLSLTFLGRTDSALLIGCLGVWCVAEWFRAGRRGRRARGPATVGLAALFALPALTIVVYLLANQAWFGSPFQISGVVKRAPLSASTVLVFAVVVVIAGAFGQRAYAAAHTKRRRSSRTRFPHAGEFASRTGWYGSFCVLVVGYYTVLQTQLWLWYLAPLVLYGMILFLLAVVDMTEAALREGRPETSPARLLLPVQAIFFGLLVIALVVEVQAFRDPYQLSIQQADRELGLWLGEHMAPGSVAASWDAGAVGYFADRPVVNLDGLVNSRAYYDAARAGRAGAFLRCERVRYVANHGDDVGGEDPSFRDLIRDIYGPDAAKNATIVYRRPFLYNGTTTGSAGYQNSGLRQMMAYVYEVPEDALDPAGPARTCP